MPEDRATTFLQMIRRSQRGRLKIYLGYGPGVGKTYQMLTEGRRLKGDGIDVVIGVVETHGRVETAKQLEGLEVVPRRTMEYHGITVDEMDVDAILKRKPQVVLVDELAHTNAPDSRNPKRYQDVQELLAAGIHVISTLNVQHLESLYNTVEKLLGVKVRERVPDSVLAEADAVVNIDLAAEDLQRRLEEGHVYPKERIKSALTNFFTASNLEHLRELTLREVASQLDFKRRGGKTDKPPAGGEDQVMVCLSSKGRNSAMLLRYGSRLAGRLNRNWYAIYVQTSSESPTAIDARTQRMLSDTLTLANQLGATVFEVKGEDIADTILRFAREYRVANLIIGRPNPVPLWRRLIGQHSVAESLIHRSVGLTVIVVDATETESTSTYELPPEGGNHKPAKAAPAGTGLAELVGVERVMIFDRPITRQDLFQQIAQRLSGGDSKIADLAIKRVEEREQTGSTFLNEGVALPHARIEGLESPRAAIALTHEGVLDAHTQHPVEVVFMLLTPASAAGTHLKILAKVGRMLQNRDLRRQLLKSKTPEAAWELVYRWEQETL